MWGKILWQTTSRIINFRQNLETKLALCVKYLKSVLFDMIQFLGIYMKEVLNNIGKEIHKRIISNVETLRAKLIFSNREHINYSNLWGNIIHSKNKSIWMYSFNSIRLHYNTNKSRYKSMYSITQLCKIWIYNIYERKDKKYTNRILTATFRSLFIPFFIYIYFSIIIMS